MLSKSDILNEFRTIERLCKQSSHDNVVAVYRYGQLGDSYYIDMELCEFNLEQYIYEFDTADRMLPALDMTNLLKIMRDVCRGLAFIHECKMIHRDIKPQNSISVLIFNNI
jgi:eukaryotic-like serine/threonine-protein kinase